MIFDATKNEPLPIDQSTGKRMEYITLADLAKECKVAYDSVRWYFRDKLRWGAWRVGGFVYVTEQTRQAFLEAQTNGEVLAGAESTGYSYRPTVSRTAYESEMSVKGAVHIDHIGTAEIVNNALGGGE